MKLSHQEFLDFRNEGFSDETELAMIVEIIGSSGTYPRPGEACNCIGISNNEKIFLIDAGNGAFSKYLERHKVESLSGIFLTHMHPDHFVDIYAMYYALRFDYGDICPLPLFLPQGGPDVLLSVLSDNAKSYLIDTFEIAELADGDVVTHDDMRLHVRYMRHPVSSMGLRITDSSGVVIAHSSDTGMCEAIYDIARHADLFICEATTADENEAIVDMHLTASQAAELALKSHAEKLLLVHLWPTVDRERALKKAREIFPNSDIARSDMIIDMKSVKRSKEQGNDGQT